MVQALVVALIQLIQNKYMHSVESSTNALSNIKVIGSSLLSHLYYDIVQLLYFHPTILHLDCSKLFLKSIKWLSFWLTIQRGPGVVRRRVFEIHQKLAALGARLLHCVSNRVSLQYWGRKSHSN